MKPLFHCVIPARHGSTRLPGKPLLDIAGLPMIERVRQAAAASAARSVIVATDHEEIRARVAAAGGEVCLTAADHASGTDRLAEVARQRGWADDAIVVNVQGDEPLIDPAAVSALARHLAEHPDDPLVTLAAEARADELDNPNAVKVVLSLAGYALYFSRSRIPYPRQAGAAAPLKHLGIYGYQRDALLRLAGLAPTPLEQSESLEQLRALENGIPLRVLRVAQGSPGVDTQEDLERVERLLRGD